MRNFLVVLVAFLIFNLPANAAKLPDNIIDNIKKSLPKAEIRFDGLITLPDGTIYLPLFPAKVKKPEKTDIVITYPNGKTLSDMPDVVIFNTDFVLLKILTDKSDKKTVMYFTNPPVEIKTGLLPQDMLVPKGLIIPDNIKGIIGGLQIATVQSNELKTESDFKEKFLPLTMITKKDLVENVKQLTDKNLYVMTCYSKNIQVLSSEKVRPEYALALKSVPIDMAAYDKFLLVTTYSDNSLKVISLSDDAVIKRIDFQGQPEEIIMDRKNAKAYVSSPTESCLYVIDLKTMLLKQKIQVNGYCEKFYLSEDSTKLAYVDKNTNEVWLIELDNEFVINDIGKFPNISKIAYSQNKLYLLSRTKNRVAIVDYATLLLIEEIEVPQKPVDVMVFNDKIYILSAQDNIISVIDTTSDKIVQNILLNTNGFSTGFYKLNSSNLAIITDTKAGKYSVLSLDKNQIIKTLPIDIPVSKMVITNKIKKISK